MENHRMSDDAIERWISEYTYKQSQCACLDIKDGYFVYCNECNELERRVETLKLALSTNGELSYWKEEYQKAYDLYMREADDNLDLRLAYDKLQTELEKQQYLAELYLEQALAAHREKKMKSRIISSRGPRKSHDEEGI